MACPTRPALSFTAHSSAPGMGGRHSHHPWSHARGRARRRCCSPARACRPAAGLGSVARGRCGRHGSRRRARPPGRLAHSGHHRAPVRDRRGPAGRRPHHLVRLSRRGRRRAQPRRRHQPQSRGRPRRPPDLVLLYNSAQNARVADRLARARHPGPAPQHRCTERRRSASPGCSGGSPDMPREADSLTAAFDAALAAATVTADAGRPERPAAGLGAAADDGRAGQLPQRAGRARRRTRTCSRDVAATCRHRQHRSDRRPRNPDLILTTADGPSAFVERPEWQAVPAVRERRFRQGHRLRVQPARPTHAAGDPASSRVSAPGAGPMRRACVPVLLGIVVAGARGWARGRLGPARPSRSRGRPAGPGGRRAARRRPRASCAARAARVSRRRQPGRLRRGAAGADPQPAGRAVPPRPLERRRARSGGCARARAPAEAGACRSPPSSARSRPSRWSTG